MAYRARNIRLMAAAAVHLLLISLELLMLLLCNILHIAHCTILNCMLLLPTTVRASGCMSTGAALNQVKQTTVASAIAVTPELPLQEQCCSREQLQGGRGHWSFQAQKVGVACRSSTVRVTATCSSQTPRPRNPRGNTRLPLLLWRH